jgi:type IV pilus assembly protein PilX
MEYACRNKQQGVVLVIALIALVAISLAGVALMRTVDTGNVISGNIAFNEAVIQMADSAAEQAYTDINNNSPYSASNCQGTVGCMKRLSPTLSSISSVTKLPCGLTGPGSVDTNGKCNTGTSVVSWSTAQSMPSPLADYTFQYVIERMCANSGQPSFIKAGVANCTAEPIYVSTATPQLQPNIGRLFYRITVQVNGPRNTRALAQYFYTTQAQDNVLDTLP